MSGEVDEGGGQSAHRTNLVTLECQSLWGRQGRQSGKVSSRGQTKCHFITTPIIFFCIAKVLYPVHDRWGPLIWERVSWVEGEEVLH